MAPSPRIVVASLAAFVALVCSYAAMNGDRHQMTLWARLHDTPWSDEDTWQAGLDEMRDSFVWGRFLVTVAVWAATAATLAAWGEFSHQLGPLREPVRAAKKKK